MLLRLDAGQLGKLLPVSVGYFFSLDFVFGAELLRHEFIPTGIVLRSVRAVSGRRLRQEADLMHDDFRAKLPLA
jgi:hypothetical protein